MSATTTDNVIELTDATFEAEVIAADEPVLVDVWAEWCGPCKALAPTIAELASEYAGRVKVGSLDADANQQVPLKLQVQSIPTVLLFHRGEVIGKFVGLTSKKDIAAALDQALA